METIIRVVSHYPVASSDGRLFWEPEQMESECIQEFSGQENGFPLILLCLLLDHYQLIQMP